MLTPCPALPCPCLQDCEAQQQQYLSVLESGLCQEAGSELVVACLQGLLDVAAQEREGQQGQGGGGGTCGFAARWVPRS